MNTLEETQQLRPLAPDEAAALQATARGEVRGWAGQASEAAVLSRVDQLGLREIEAASAQMSRLEAAAGDTRAEALLDELNRCVAAIHQPPEPRRLRLFAAPPPPIEQRLAAAEPALQRLLGELAGERDRLARAAIAGRALLDRLGGGDAALERACHLADLLTRGAERAARELVHERPDRARFLTEEVAGRLLERSGDMLTQLAVIRQAQLSLALLCDGQEALARAIDRTRHIMVGALRVAAAAARALGEGARMTGRAEALDAAAQRRNIEGAVAEMRGALAAR